jgi:hypothetical protein
LSAAVDRRRRADRATFGKLQNPIRRAYLSHPNPSSLQPILHRVRPSALLQVSAAKLGQSPHLRLRRVEKLRCPLGIGLSRLPSKKHLRHPLANSLGCSWMHQFIANRDRNEHMFVQQRKNIHRTYQNQVVQGSCVRNNHKILKIELPLCSSVAFEVFQRIFQFHAVSL